MRILMINSVCGIGSTGRICTDLADLLEKQGHEVKIAYGRGNVPEKYERYAVRIGTDADVRLHGVKTRLLDRHGFGSRAATVKFIEWVESYSPDVIHLHNVHGYYVNIEVLFKYLRRCEKKIIWTLHDCWTFTGHCSYFDYVGCEKWKTECFACPQVKEYPKSFLIDSSKTNFADKKELFTNIPNMMLVTPSVWLKNVVGSSFLGEYPIQVIPNGIDISVFNPTESDFREKNQLTDKKIILGVANIWDRRKGLDTFAELSKKLDEKYKIVLVGLSKKQIKALPQNILGIERTDSVKQLCEIYTAADVFVNPTMEDNYPTVNMEAIACGTPVVTFRTGGSPEMLDPLTGVVVERNDIDSLENEIKRITNESVFDKNNCVQRSAEFDKNKCFGKYVELIGMVSDIK